MAAVIIKGAKVRVSSESAGGVRDALAVNPRARASEKAIRDFYRKALKTAWLLKKSSLRFTVSAADEEGTLKAHAKIMAQEIFRVALGRRGGLKNIIVCVAGRKENAVFKRFCLGYLDYMANKLQSPFVTVDAVIELNQGIVLIKRSNPPYGYALPGGFVDYGESLEKAMVREVREETGLKVIGLKQFRTYSDPGRDPRFHTVATVFVCRAKGRLRAGDDAAEAKVFLPEQISRLQLAFDHRSILQEYFSRQKSQ